MTEAESSDSEVECTPPELRAVAANATNNLLPKKSKDIYLTEYKRFQDWRAEKSAGVSENVLLAYFTELSEKYAPPTLWAKYSFLRSTLSIYDKIDISKYTLLLALLKRLQDGYVSKKARPFTPDEFNTFLDEAPNEIYLDVKIAAIFAVMGALRISELCNITLGDISQVENERVLLIQVLITKNKRPTSFIVPEIYYNLILQYRMLRPKDVPHRRLFINYQRGKCTIQPIGKNKLGTYPKKIADYLELPDSKLYTGHSFRRTCITWLADSGADIHTIKQHGNWKSTKVAERYCSDAKTEKTKIADRIMSHHRPNDSRKRKSDQIATAVYYQQPTTSAAFEEPVVFEQEHVDVLDQEPNELEQEPVNVLEKEPEVVQAQRPQVKRFKPKKPFFSQLCSQTVSSVPLNVQKISNLDHNNNNNVNDGIVIELETNNFNDFITEEFVSPNQSNPAPRQNFVFNNCQVTFNYK